MFKGAYTEEWVNKEQIEASLSLSLSLCVCVCVCVLHVYFLFLMIPIIQWSAPKLALGDILPLRDVRRSRSIAPIPRRIGTK